MTDMKALRNEPIHTRTITITTYECDDDSIMVEGVLRDERKRGTYSMTAEDIFPPGVIHNLTIRILVKGNDLEIKDVDVEMTDVPREDCRETKASLNPLIGHSIAPGFTVWVKNTFGGPNGCTHLNALLLAMAPAAVQGYWTHKASKPIPLDSLESLPVSAYLIDTCWVWRREGPLVNKMLTMLKEIKDKKAS